jgi:actin-related protein 2
VQGDESKLQSFKLGIEEPPLRRHMAFAGASVLADVLAGYDSHWKSRQHYLDSRTSLAVDT